MVRLFVSRFSTKQKYTGAKAGMEREEEAEGEVALAQKRRHRQEISAMMGLPKDNLSSSPVLVQVCPEHS